MNPKRGNRILSITALLSLLLACFFLSGYVGRFGPALAWITRDSPGFYNVIYFQAFHGHVEMAVDTQLPVIPTLMNKLWHGIHFVFLMRPDQDRRFHFNEPFQFDLSLVPVRGQAFIAACPIWFAILPCLIAPALWLRKRSRKQDDVGFPVGEIPRPGHTNSDAI